MPRLRKPSRVRHSPIAPGIGKLASVQHEREEAQHLWSAFGAELGRFPQARARACLEAANRIGHCHSLPEVLELQGRYVQEAMHDYMDEAARLAEVWTQACLRTLSGLQPR